MTEIETAIAVLGTLLAVVVTHLFDERRETNRMRQDIALQPLSERQDGLKKLYIAMAECFIALTRAAVHPPETLAELKTAIDVPMGTFENSIVLNSLWLPPPLSNHAVEVMGEFSSVSVALTGRFPSALPSSDAERLVKPFSRLATAIAQALGLDILETKFEQIARTLRQEVSS